MDSTPISFQVMTNPSNVWLEKSKEWYDINDTVTLTAHADNATSYWITVYKDGQHILTQALDGSLSFSASQYGKGEYYSWITAYNSAGEMDSTPISFHVKENPESISLNKTSLSLYKGESYNLKAMVTPDDATDKTVTWQSSDTSIVTVSNGKVTAKSVGTATITAKTSNGKTATCKITVTEPAIEVKSISLNKTALSMNVGNTANLKATVTPANATDKTVTWK